MDRRVALLIRLYLLQLSGGNLHFVMTASVYAHCALFSHGICFFVCLIYTSSRGGLKCNVVYPPVYTCKPCCLVINMGGLNSVTSFLL